MRTVAELIATKQNPAVHTVPSSTSVYDAMAIMASKRIGALVVVEEGRTVGIVTERDYARKVVLEHRASRATPVRTIMSTPVIHVRPSDTTDRCLVLMAHNRLRHLPVQDGDELVGMVSIRDLVDEIVADRRVLIEDIEHALVARRGQLASEESPANG